MSKILLVVEDEQDLAEILEYNFKKTVWVKEAKGLVLKNANFVKFKKEELDLKKLKAEDFDLM